MKLIPINATNNCKSKEVTAIKSMEFEAMDYPEIEIHDLQLYTCGDKNCRDEDCDLFLKIRVSISRKELFTLLGALKNEQELWREEDLPCKIKISVKKDKKGMYYWKNEKRKNKKVDDLK